MSCEINSYYRSYNIDRLDHDDDRLKIERHIYLNDEAKIASLLKLTDEQIAEKLAESEMEEEKLYEAARSYADRWSAAAANSALLREVQKYRNIRLPKTTGNQWETDEYGTQRISNTVYGMIIRVYESTKYDRETRQSVPVSWHVSYSLFVHNPIKNSVTIIANIDRKLFKDKAKAEAYIAGRKKAYAHLFAEENPPVPKEYANNFTFYGAFLPGYRIAEEESK